jgi:hypothetical protein
MLEPLQLEGFQILHDRRAPDSGAKIDHIVIGPTGVYVIESKAYKGPPRVTGRAVWTSGRRRNEWDDDARRAAEAVRYALYDELTNLGISVEPIICAHEVDLPMLGSSIEGVAIMTAANLVKRLRRDQPVLNPERVKRLADLAEERLPPAG